MGNKPRQHRSSKQASSKVSQEENGKENQAPIKTLLQKENSWVFTNQDAFKKESEEERKIYFKHRRSLNEKLKLEVGESRHRERQVYILNSSKQT